MKHDEIQDECEEETFDDAPVSAALQVVRQEGRDTEDDEETEEDDDEISLNEVERLLFKEMWGAVLDLPATEDDFFFGGQFADSAFNTHDFRRVYGEVDRYGYALAMARKERQHCLWMLEMVMEKVQDPAKYIVLRYLKRGWIEVGHTTGEMFAIAHWWSRLRRAQERIGEIMKARRGRR